MALYALTAMIFLVTLGLTISGVYFLVAAPAGRKKMQVRLAAIEQSSFEGRGEEFGLLRAEVLSQVPWVNRFLLRIPLVTRLHIFIQQAGMQTTAGMLILISLAAGLFALLIGLLFNIANILLVVAVIAACAV